MPCKTGLSSSGVGPTDRSKAALLLQFFFVCISYCSCAVVFCIC